MTHPIAGAHPPPGRPREEALLDGLTPEQAQAVQHGPGPLLLIAGPGAGKTKTLIHRIARLLQTGAAQPWEILAVTFSVRAAGELRLRLADLLGEQVARGVTAATFHSICARILREHAGVFGRTESYTVYDQADVRRVIEWLLSDQQRGRIQQALADYGQPAAAEVLAEISLAKNRLLSPDSYEQAARHTAAPLIAAVWREAEIELQRSNALDFDDLLTFAVRLLAEHPHRLAFYRQRWRWLLVDEYQDTNEAQSVLVALLAGAGGNVCCVGDDDQCLLQGTEVTMADGTRKPIESVKPGDLVMSAHGGGRRGPSRVSSVRTRQRAEGVTIRTAAGREIVSTPEHIHFAGYRLGLTPQLHIVYLMHRQGRGFRIGTTRVYTNGQVKAVIGLQQRCLHEHADAAWVVSTHDSAQDAKIAEVALSLRYGLPTIPFVSRRSSRTTGEGLIDDQLAIDHVFRMLDTESAGARLLADQGLSHAHPHQISQSAEGRRRILTVTLCGGKNGHRLDLTGHDPRVAEDLTRAGYRPTFPKPASPQHWRVSLHRADLGQLLAHAQRLGDLTHARIRLLANVGAATPPAVNVSLPLMPASAVRPGMVLATEDGDYDTVVSVAGVVLDRPVFDLDVERTHNFLANGIVTHNCIYSWRGAQPRNILAFGERFPAHARIVLGRNFRCRSEILDAAVACVAHNAQREAKALIAMRGGGGEVRVIAYGSDRHEADCRRGRDRPGTRPRHPRRRGAGARAHRLRDRAAAGRARPGRDPAPGARQPRPVRALRGPRRARLPRAARQPRRRAGIPPRRRLTQTRCRHRDRQPGDRARPRHTSGRPDHGERARERDSRGSAPAPSASGSRGLAKDSTAPAASCATAARSGTSSSPP